MTKLDVRLLRRLLRLARPYWVSDDRRWAWGQLVLLLLLLVGYTWSNVLFNEQSGEFTSALAARDEGRFWRSIALFFGLLVVAVPIYSYYYYVRDQLAIRWRRWLTDRVLERYFDRRAFYRLVGHPTIDNPDQRLAEDIGSFTQQFLNYLLLFASAAIELFAFTSVLWSISRLLVLFLVVYAAAGTFVTVGVFSGRMIRLHFERLRREADFRFGLIRVRENAEPIALYRGEARELAQIQDRFSGVFANFTALIGWSLRLNLFTYTYSWVTLAVPSIIIAPRVLSGELEVGRVVQAAGAFSAVLAAVTVFVNNLEYLSRFAAGVERLDDFVTYIAASPGGSGGRIATVEAEALAFEGLTIQTPDKERTLISNLTVRVPPGTSLLVVGPSGCGKSSLFRVVAGLWDAGSGRVVRPPLERMLFLPQQPYMILGTLRQQLSYPGISDLAESTLREVLAEVNLGDLEARCGGFDAELDFQKVLSVGERQRLAFARVLLRRPSYVLLDEATSALDRDNEARVYETLAATGATVVSVSHHAALLRCHDMVLELTNRGDWRLQSTSDYRAGAEAELQ